MKLVPFSSEVHARTKVLPITSFAMARGAPMLPLYGGELMRAARIFPICFTAEKDGYFPAALMAVEPGRNLFVGENGRWLADYVPAVLRRQPFALAQVAGSDNWVLCLDEDSGLLSETEGNSLIMPDGSNSNMVAQVTEFLVTLERDRAATLAACAALDRHGLIVPWDLMINRTDGTQQKVDGLFHADAGRLAQLPGEALVELRDCGALVMVYLQEFSRATLASIGQLAAAHAEADAKKAAIQNQNFNLDNLFGIDSDDPFQF